MKQYQIPCGKNSISIQIPDNVPVRQVESRKIAPVPDVKRAVEESLSRPIGTKRLRDLVKPNQTVALVVTDITRQLPEEIILPLLVRELEAGGVRKRDITAIVATGTHRSNTPEELYRKFGDIVNEISFVNHDPHNANGLVDLGTSLSGIPLVFNHASGIASRVHPDFTGSSGSRIKKKPKGKGGSHPRRAFDVTNC